MKKGYKLLIGITFFVLLLLRIMLFENDYMMQEREVTIQTENEDLNGFVALPKEKGEGVVIFVHGDGPQNATQDGGYKPLMERFAKEGFASVSWAKPGVDGSHGNWLNQSMDDRAEEVENVLEWVKNQETINSEKIILWGSSQAGWVIPKVQQNHQDITASILIAPAINWIRQGEYYTAEKLKSEGKSSEEITSVLNNDRRKSELIRTGVSYQEYVQETEDRSLSEERYTFVQKNIMADATNDIKKIKSPVHVVLAEEDQNVDSSETARTYREMLPESQVTVRTIPNVEHSMLNPSLDNSQILIYLSAIFAPKHTLVSNVYLDYCQKLIRQL
ncbi:alpha/beta hydrolase [Terribacillus halophilus]|uniref:alpha/beta hydrolase n=1 Tax=Terribacillus halophilus TaxID=361279 RepID=UPI000984332D|nr:alpha/beta hydrolase [Terribacillus halophilus]